VFSDEPVLIERRILLRKLGGGCNSNIAMFHGVHEIRRAMVFNIASTLAAAHADVQKLCSDVLNR